MDLELEIDFEHRAGSMFGSVGLDKSRAMDIQEFIVERLVNSKEGVLSEILENALEKFGSDVLLYLSMSSIGQLYQKISRINGYSSNLKLEIEKQEDEEQDYIN